jgi:hypothetical protein
MNPGPVLHGEIHVGQHVGFALVDERLSMALENSPEVGAGIPHFVAGLSRL